MNLLNVLRSTILSLTLLTSGLAFSGESATTTEVILAQKSKVEKNIAALKDLKELLGRYKRAYSNNTDQFIRFPDGKIENVGPNKVIEGREVVGIAGNLLPWAAVTGTVVTIIKAVDGDGKKTLIKFGAVTLTLWITTLGAWDYAYASIGEINAMEAEVAKKELELKIESKVLTKLLKEMDLE